MLRTLDDMRFLCKYLETDDPDKETQRLIVDASSIPVADKERLLIYDESFFYVKGYHMITDYEALL